MLESIGITPDEERVYRALLRERGASLAALARATGIDDRRLRRILSALEEKALVSRAAIGSKRFMPAPPDVAIESLLEEQQAELQVVRGVATDLLREFEEGKTPQSLESVVEIVVGRDAMAHRYLQLRRSAREWLSLDKPPYVTPTTDCRRAGRDQATRRIPVRVIYAQAVLTLPGRLEDIQEAAAAGQDCRVLPDVPIKMAIADLSVAWLPLNLDAGSEQGLLLHDCPLLQALIVLFELLWSKASPLSSSGDHHDGESDLSPEESRLLMLLAAGVTDDAIARQLGIGSRTVSRRVSNLMERLGATTRFQAGLQVGRGSWL